MIAHRKHGVESESKWSWTNDECQTLHHEETTEQTRLTHAASNLACVILYLKLDYKLPTVSTDHVETAGDQTKYLSLTTDRITVELKDRNFPVSVDVGLNDRTTRSPHNPRHEGSVWEYDSKWKKEVPTTDESMICRLVEVSHLTVWEWRNFVKLRPKSWKIGETSTWIEGFFLWESDGSRIQEFRAAISLPNINVSRVCTTCVKQHLSFYKQIHRPCLGRFLSVASDSFCRGHDPPYSSPWGKVDVWRPHSNVSLSLSFSVLYKLFATALYARFAPSLHEVQPPDQGGFWPKPPDGGPLDGFQDLGAAKSWVGCTTVHHDGGLQEGVRPN